MSISALVITYNQEHTIGETLEGVVSQVLEVPYEVVIADDCSSDGTPKIIQEFADAHSGLIRFIRRESNLGACANLAQTYLECAGKYVAICEGDDVWTDPRKLAVQALALENDPASMICMHPVLELPADPTAWPAVYPAEARVSYSLDDLLRANPMHTCAVMYRRIHALEFPEWYGKSKVGDWPLHLLHALRGHAICLPNVMATYRVHDAGIWSSMRLGERLRHSISVLENMLPLLPESAREVAETTLRGLRSEHEGLQLRST